MRKKNAKKKKRKRVELSGSLYGLTSDSKIGLKKTRRFLKRLPINGGGTLGAKSRKRDTKGKECRNQKRLNAKRGSAPRQLPADKREKVLKLASSWTKGKHTRRK